METRQGLEIHNLILQEMKLFRATVDAVVRHLPLLTKDHIVLLNGIFDGVLDHIGCRKDLLSMLLGVSLDVTDLCHMGSPLYFSIVHL